MLKYVMKKYVKAIDIGNVGGSKKSDDGNAVHVTFGAATADKDSSLSMRYTNNLNEPGGKQMYLVLVKAMLLNLPVTIYDNSPVSINCDDFDRVELVIEK